MLKIKMTLLSLQIIIFLRRMISATKILSTQPRMTPSEGPRGWGEPIRLDHAAVAANGSLWWCCLLDGELVGYTSKCTIPT